MSKGIYIGFRISEDEVRRLKTLQGGKTISDCIRDLIREKFTENKKELQGIEELLKKLDSSDMVKISKDIKKNLLQNTWANVLINALAKEALDEKSYTNFKTSTDKAFNRLKQRKED